MERDRSWLDDSLREIQKKYSECVEKDETALMSYLVSIAKMLNSLMKRRFYGDL